MSGTVAVGLPVGLSRLELVCKLTGEVGQPLVILPWWASAFAALDDPAIRELLLWLMRQAGKSQCLSAMADTELLLRPGSYTIYIAASGDQAGAVYHRKIRRPLERLLTTLGMRDAVRLTRRGIEIPELGSALEVLATNEATAPGRSPSLLILDEARHIPDEVYSKLAPSVIGAGGKVVVASTSGPPRGFFYELTQNPTPETWLYTSTANENPHADARVLAFLRRRLSLIAPAAARRELENEFTEDGDSFLPNGLIEVAIDDMLAEVPTSDGPCFTFGDLSRRRDLTTMLTVERVAPRVPEATDHLRVVSL